MTMKMFGNLSPNAYTCHIIHKYYEIIHSFTLYTYCLREWVIRGNMSKHQLVIVFHNTNILQNVILEGIGIYYGSLRDVLKTTFVHHKPNDKFGYSDDDNKNECTESDETTYLIFS